MNTRDTNHRDGRGKHTYCYKAHPCASYISPKDLANTQQTPSPTLFPIAQME